MHGVNRLYSKLGEATNKGILKCWNATLDQTLATPWRRMADSIVLAVPDDATTLKDAFDEGCAKCQDAGKVLQNNTPLYHYHKDVQICIMWCALLFFSFTRCAYQWLYDLCIRRYETFRFWQGSQPYASIWRLTMPSQRKLGHWNLPSKQDSHEPDCYLDCVACYEGWTKNKVEASHGIS